MSRSRMLGRSGYLGSTDTGLLDLPGRGRRLHKRVERAAEKRRLDREFADAAATYRDETAERPET